MNIVMVGPFGLSPKGTVKVRALPLAQALSARGHQVTVLVPPWDDAANSGMEWFQGGVRVVNVRLPLNIPGFFHVVLCLRLARRAMALHPDVVHFFKPKAFAGLAHFALWWAGRLGLLGGVPAFVADEDDWERAWNDVSPYSGIEKTFFRWQEDWGLRHADTITVASRSLEALVQDLGVAPGRVFYLPNGWRATWGDHGPRHPAAVRMLWELEAKRIILLYTRFVEFRLQRIVSIVRQLAERTPDFRLLIVGEGLRNEESDLDEMLSEAGLGPYVVFAGWVAREHVGDYFAAAELAIFPYDDTVINRTKCSVRLVDTLAAGVPVVADDVGQNGAYIVDGESGLLVPPENDCAMVEAIARVLGDVELKNRLGTGAAARIRTHFGWDRLASVAEAAYHGQRSEPSIGV